MQCELIISTRISYNKTIKKKVEFKFKALHLSPTSGDRQQCKPWNYGPNKHLFQLANSVLFALV